MTLSVHGLLVAQDDLEVTEKEAVSGKMFFFILHSQNTRKKGTWCPWKFAMWVPDDEVSTWRDNLQPGNVFMLIHGSAAADAREDGKPFPVEINIKHSDLKKLLI